MRSNVLIPALLAFGLFSFTSARACEYPIEWLLEESTVLTMARVIEYGPEEIRAETLPVSSWLGIGDRPAGPFTAGYPGTGEDARARVLGAVGFEEDGPRRNRWPKPGQPVLLGVNEVGKIFLIGTRSGRGYRIWFVNGIDEALYVTCSGESLAPSGKKNTGYDRWDSCVIPTSQVKLREPVP